LIQDGYNADALHGDLSQAQRDQVMKKFRGKSLQLLVATDVAARGLDVNDLTHVIHYNLPDDTAGYTHRSGRTGRAGRTGISVAIVHLKERYKIREIEKRLEKKFKLCRIPSGKEICEKQLVRLLDIVKNIKVNYAQIDTLYEKIAETFADLNREEIIKKFISLELRRFLDIQNAPDLNVNVSAEKQHGKKSRPCRDFGTQAHGRHHFSRFSLNVGRRDGVLPQGLMGRINRITGGGNIRIGKIEIMRNTTHIEADSKFSSQILGAFEDFNINGKTVVIKTARDSNSANRPKPAGIHRRKRPNHKTSGSR